jgi:hypothetical protein
MIDLREEQHENAPDSMRVNSKLVSKEIDIGAVPVTLEFEGTKNKRTISAGR